MTRIVCDKMWQYDMVGSDEIARQYWRHMVQDLKNKKFQAKLVNEIENKEQQEDFEIKMVFGTSEVLIEQHDKCMFKKRTFSVNPTSDRNNDQQTHGSNYNSPFQEEEVKLSLPEVCSDISNCEGLGAKFIGGDLKPLIPLARLKEILD